MTVLKLFNKSTLNPDWCPQSTISFNVSNWFE